MVGGVKMKKNPWENIPLAIYENHMSDPKVEQLQALNSIMKKQVDKNYIENIVVFGISGGNGLECFLDYHNEKKIIYGFDINEEYLEICKKRYACKFANLTLEKIDLKTTAVNVDNVDLLIANLIIEYISLQSFIQHIQNMKPTYVSVSLIETENCNQITSESPYTHYFEGLEEVYEEVDYLDLIHLMNDQNYILISKEIKHLKSSKEIISLEFKLH